MGSGEPDRERAETRGTYYSSTRSGDGSGARGYKSRAELTGVSRNDTSAVLLGMARKGAEAQSADANDSNAFGDGTQRRGGAKGCRAQGGNRNGDGGKKDKMIGF